MFLNDRLEPEGRGSHPRRTSIQARTLGQIGQGVNDSYLTPRSPRRRTTPSAFDQLLVDLLTERQESGAATPNIG